MQKKYTWPRTCNVKPCGSGESVKTNSAKYKILVVDDEEKIISSIQSILSDQPEIEVIGCTQVVQALSLYEKNNQQFALVLMDYRLPDQSGAEVTKKLLKMNPHQIVAMYSGDESQEAAIESWRSGAVDFIEKRSSTELTKNKINLCLKKYMEFSEIFQEATQSENRDLIESVGLAGSSAEMAHIAYLIKKSATNDCPVLITGESGVGKEEVAKAIHRLSKRQNMNFVSDNMTAIPHELFESTLFGHIKGSFTGASDHRVGHFKSANGGTIFLDEIGDMRLDQQVKLLRAVQSGEFYSVGSNKLEKVNVRIIAATNKNLEEAVLKKEFREDLFYRLNVIRIHVPPLRDRIEDIRPLVENYRKIKKSDKVVLMEVIKKFEKYPWPGNVRELYAELLRLFEFFNDEQRITLKHIDSKFFADQKSSVKQKNNMTLEEFLAQQAQEEISLIKHHIKKYGSLRDAAAEGLKCAYTTMYSRMLKLNIISKGDKNEKDNKNTGNDSIGINNGRSHRTANINHGL